jgi:glyoxylase-like metal-dependent hydrolase (beta-lactamase superfamily II)
MIFFERKKLSEHVTSITDITGVHSFLIEGQQTAALIDTGTGAGNLKEYIKGLTKLPVTVILTHGHCDHAGGAALFDEVWLHKADWNLAGRHASMEMKKGYINFCGGKKAAEMEERDFMPERTKGYLNLQDGQLFELGGITLEIICVPGHTQGMCCVLNREERSILFGDACNPSVFMWDEEATSISEYQKSLLHLQTYEQKYDTVFLSHGDEVASKELLESVLMVTKDILAGAC